MSRVSVVCGCVVTRAVVPPIAAGVMKVRRDERGSNVMRIVVVVVVEGRIVTRLSCVAISLIATYIMSRCYAIRNGYLTD